MAIKKLRVQAGVDQGYGPNLSKILPLSQSASPSGISISVVSADDGSGAHWTVNNSPDFSLDPDAPAPDWFGIVGLETVAIGANTQVQLPVSTAALQAVLVGGTSGFASVTGVALNPDAEGSLEGGVVYDNAAALITTTTLLANLAVPFLVTDTFLFDLWTFEFNNGAGNSLTPAPGGPPFIGTVSLDLTIATVEDVLIYMDHLTGTPLASTVSAGRLLIWSGLNNDIGMTGASLSKIGLASGDVVAVATTILTQLPGLNGWSIDLDILGYEPIDPKDNYGRVQIQFGGGVNNYASVQTVTGLNNFLQESLGYPYGNTAQPPLTLTAGLIFGALTIKGAAYNGPIRIPYSPGNTLLGLAPGTYEPVVNLPGAFVGTQSLNNNTAVSALITTATLLSGDAGVSSDSIMSPFIAGDTLDVNGLSTVFGTGGGQIDPAGSIQTLLTAIDNITGTSSASGITSGVVTLQIPPLSGLTITGSANAVTAIGSMGIALPVDVAPNFSNFRPVTFIDMIVTQTGFGR
jgi:hypothetical protein